MPIISKYNGKPILMLNPDIKPPYVPYSFGAGKARVIISRIIDIKKFLDSPPMKAIPNVLDITPENNNGSKFVINKYKAELIIKHFKEIERFVKESDDKFNRKNRRLREAINYVKSGIA